MFNNFEDIKRVAEKFGKGKIIPQRILKAIDKSSKKQSNRITFGCDMYRLKSKSGSQIFVVDWIGENVEYLIKVANNTKNISLVGNFYGKNGNRFIGNVGITDEEWIDNINKSVFKCNFLN